MRVSILTSCYNCGPYLKECANSIFRQKHTDWEWIFVDDRSSDNSLKIIKKISKGKDVRIIKNGDRLKCGGSYNKALKEASGEVCCVIDADDALSSKSALSKIVRLYEQHPEISYVWTQFMFCDPKMRIVKKGSCRVPPMSFLQAGLEYNKYRHAFSHWRTFRTCLRDKSIIFNPKLSAAVDKWMGYILEEIGVGGFYAEPLYLYRQRLGGLSFKGRKQWKKMLNIFRDKRSSNNIIPFPAKEIYLT